MKQRTKEVIDKMYRKSFASIQAGDHLYQQIIANPGTNFPAKAEKILKERAKYEEKWEKNPFSKALEWNKKVRDNQMALELYD